jgi:hypothetical protein
MQQSTLLSRRIQRGHVTLVSVYPDKPHAVERPFDGWTVYQIDACPKGEEPRLLQVLDAVQFTKDALNREVINESLIFAEQVAGDLLAHWARTPIGAPSGSGPGIGLIAGDEPTDEEIQVLLERQNLLFEYLYHEGMRMAQNQDWRGINRHHRMAAEWLGLEEVWARDPRKEGNRPCPACTVPISTYALICPNCRTHLQELPAELAALQPEFAGARSGRGGRRQEA